jgi:ABC-type transport system involved in multi-copper enzyme maturation permease subunit
MPRHARSFANWVRRSVIWPQSRRSWVELLLTLLMLAGASGLAEFGRGLPLAYQVIGWALLVAALGVLLRRGWVKLFGPVLFYDLVTQARRNRFFVVRGLYALVLLVILFSVYDKFFNEVRTGWRATSLKAVQVGNSAVFVPVNDYPNRLTGEDLARFAQLFFGWAMMVQFLAVILLTPAYTAGAVAEEKDRQTLEFLLATDLHNREIVLSKLASRLANLTLLVLTGLPVLSLTQLWGGVDPGLVVAAFAGTGLTMISLAALSILNSVYAKRPRDAIVLTYLATLAYLGFSFISLEVLRAKWLAKAEILPGPVPITLQDLGNVFNTGNPAVAFSKLNAALDSNMPLAATLPPLVRDYALFHGLVAVICSTWAVLRLRAVAIRHGPRQMRRRSRRARRWRKPRVGRQPMLWKELFAEPGLPLNWFGRAIVALIILASFLPAMWLLGSAVWWNPDPYAAESGFFSEYSGYGSRLAEAFNRWVRLVGTLVACLTLVGVAVRAASSISGERDRQTLDGLLTSPLESRTIVFAKWLGSILSVRWAGLWLCLIWGVGLATGGLDRTVVPWLVLGWSVYAAFLASLGLWFSTRSRTTLRATLATLLATAIAWFGHWLFWVFFSGTTALNPAFRETSGWAYQLAMYGLTPPAALSWLSFSGEFHGLEPTTAGTDPMESFVCLLAGFVLWGGAALGLWSLALKEFSRLARRVRRHSPHAPRHWTATQPADPPLAEPVSG